ncbi:MAG TPA: response regulator [Kofleriaceae bacterium]|jgi:CheY-like chemotaxis protein|nr:response regulator [Kofleriaceae bacterium]
MTPETSRSARPDSIGARLIIADDNEEMRWLVRAILGDRFEEIVEAADGRELIWHLMRSRRGRTRAGKPCVVVVADVWMPVYDGLEVIAAWQDGEPNVPLVVITSFPEEAVREKAAMLGAVFLAKPFTRADLLAAVAQAIGERG